MLPFLESLSIISLLYFDDFLPILPASLFHIIYVLFDHIQPHCILTGLLLVGEQGLL